MACFSCFSARYLSRTIKANFCVVPWHFLTDVSLGSPAKEKNDLEESSFVYRGGKQGALFTYLLTLMSCVRHSVHCKRTHIWGGRSCLWRLLTGDVSLNETWQSGSSWWEDFMKQSRKLVFVWKLLGNCWDRKLLRESHIDEEHWRGRHFWIIDGLCNGQPQDKIFTQYFYGLNWLQCKPSLLLY